MATFFTCPHCSNVVRAPDEWAGHQAGCPHCRVRLLVPGRRHIVRNSWVVLGACTVVALAVVAGATFVLGHSIGRLKDKSELGAAEAQARDLARKLAVTESDLADGRQAAAAVRTERDALASKLDEVTRDRNAKLAVTKKREDTIREMEGKLKAALAVGVLGNRREADLELALLHDLKKLQGTWKATKFLVNGADLGPELEMNGFEFECRLDRLITVGGVASTGVFVLRPGATPSEIDLRSEQLHGGKAIEGIYSFEGETVVLCFARAGEARPTRFEPGNRVALIHLSKAIKKN